MIALARKLRIPCRYVSGYLFHADPARRPPPKASSHALGRGPAARTRLDRIHPTTTCSAAKPHPRRRRPDYAEVPPRARVQRWAESELSVSVSVALADAPVERRDGTSDDRPAAPRRRPWRRIFRRSRSRNSSSSKFRTVSSPLYVVNPDSRWFFNRKQQISPQISW